MIEEVTPPMKFISSVRTFAIRVVAQVGSRIMAMRSKSFTLMSEELRSRGEVNSRADRKFASVGLEMQVEVLAINTP